MLGRGLLTNPALAETKASCIAEEKAGSVPRLTVERIRAFHADVLEGYRKAIPGDKNVLFKMKELWTYLGEADEENPQGTADGGVPGRGGKSSDGEANSQ